MAALSWGCTSLMVQAVLAGRGAGKIVCRARPCIIRPSLISVVESCSYVWTSHLIFMLPFWKHHVPWPGVLLRSAVSLGGPSLFCITVSSWITTSGRAWQTPTVGARWSSPFVGRPAPVTWRRGAEAAKASAERTGHDRVQWHRSPGSRRTPQSPGHCPVGRRLGSWEVFAKGATLKSSDGISVDNFK